MTKAMELISTPQKIIKKGLGEWSTCIQFTKAFLINA